MDRISSLPNDVLCHILSFLPTKHAVATSVLSSRWVNLWAFLSIIDLDDTLYLNPSRKWTNPALFLDFVDTLFQENYVNISGIALKRLELELSTEYDDDSDAMVVIDAPHLEYIRLKDGFLASYVVKNKPAISKVRLDVGDYDEDYFLDEEGLTRLNRVNELLQGLVNAKFLSVSVRTSKVIFSQKWNLPVLPCLTKLELDVHTSSWILVLYWLESCPNLKVLTLIIKENPTEYRVEKLELSEPDHVPSCLSLHLKEIEVKRCMKVEEREMLEYLLLNAKVLDKLTINSHVYIKDGIRQYIPSRPFF